MTTAVPQEKTAAAPAAETDATVPGRAATVVVAGMIAAWLAAGSTGMLAPGLQRGLCWTALGAALLAALPRARLSPRDWGIFTAAVVAGLAAIAVRMPAVNVLGVALALVGLARLQSGAGGRAVLLTATAVTIFGLFRLASASIPAIWMLTDALGHALGRLAGWMAGRPLSVGATFGGIDILVLVTALAAVWLPGTPRPRLGRAVGIFAAILLGQMAYLVLLAFWADLTAALPDVVQPPQSDVSLLGQWAWGNAVRTFLPWNLPLVGAAIQATIAACMFRWGGAGDCPHFRAVRVADAENGTVPLGARHHPTFDALMRFGPAALPVLVALLGVLAPGAVDLKGRRVVAYAPAGVDWSIPQHDQPAPRTAPMYGLLRELVASLGGQFVRSADLADDELAKADLLLVLPPGEAGKGAAAADLLPADRVERIAHYVRKGGALLVAAEPETHRGAAENLMNPLLAATSMRVADDTAIPAAADWEYSCEALSHPATAGVESLRNPPCVGRGVSIRLGWRAGPMLVGRWAWADASGDAARLASAPMQPGDRLGDLVLGASENVGGGQVALLGDVSTLGNDALPSSYPFVARLLACLAAKSGTPQALWRQVLGLAAVAGLVGLLACRPTMKRIAAAAVAGAVAVVCCAAVNGATPVLPDGRAQSPNNVAYIDASHLEAYSGNPWGVGGLGEFSRILMRNGYLPLLLTEFDAAHLQRAGLLVSIAPGRPFSPGERQAVQDFVSGGGTFLSMVGAEDESASRALLADFDLYVPPMPLPPSDVSCGTEPLGSFSQTFAGKSKVQFYTAWPVTGGQEVETLLSWSDARHDHAAVVCRNTGSGAAVLLGDTHFAMNENLAAAAGKLSNNSDFWRWLLAKMPGHEKWVPTDNKPPAAEPGESGPIELPAADAPDAKGGRL